MFLSCRPFVVITTLSTGLVGVEVRGDRSDFCLAYRTNINILDGTTVENKGKLILNETYMLNLNYKVRFHLIIIDIRPIA